MKIAAAGRTDVGLQREHNEDSFVVLPRHGLYLVADGMGGHAAGEVASRMAADSASAFFDSASFVEPERLSHAIHAANWSVRKAAARSQDLRGMGTTVVALYVTGGGRVYVAHVGDSRAYRLRGGALERLTRDHSLLEEYLAARPDLTPEQIAGLPRDVITRALGLADTVQVDTASFDAVPGDRYLLCSDGLSGMVSDREVQEVVQGSTDPGAACEELIRRANARGGEDNVTVVVLFAGGAQPIRPAGALVPPAPASGKALALGALALGIGGLGAWWLASKRRRR